MWTEPILHVDMDAFYVEVERRRDPSLIGKPVAVGGTGPRGVIASASYEARRHGVHSAQSTIGALKLCRDLVVVPPSHGRYAEVSTDVFEVFRGFTPHVEGLSLDEAFLDVSGLRRHFTSPVEVAMAVRGEIRSRLGLPASVGVASSKFLAKLASEEAKPDGWFHVPLDSQLEFLHALAAESLWGVGPATLAGLQRLGVVTVGDLAELPDESVLRALGPANGRHLLDLARGIDPRPVIGGTEAKSISVEETYDRDLEGRETVETALLAHAQSLSGRLRRSGMAARTVTVKVRYQDFTTITRSVTLGSPVDSPRDLYQAGGVLLSSVDLTRPVRLLGLGGSGLEPGDEPRQLDLGTDADWVKVSQAVAEVRERFGEHLVEPARLLEQDGQDKESDR
ncbi:MAG TPA: DNA polymerase IV [Acidimicrobiia bacterium]|nr:DNA polymerase IV [Acidimicrobiia bacterium]